MSDRTRVVALRPRICCLAADARDDSPYSTYADHTMSPPDGDNTGNREHTIKAMIRAELPPEVLARKPARALFVIPIVTLIVISSATVAVVPLQWFIAVVVSFVIGNLYVSLMLIGHEIGHGATVRSPRLQYLALYAACWIFCLSPHLWKIWHGQVHHPNANIDGKDPDQFGTLHDFNKRRPLHRFFGKIVPGSGHPLSYIYPFLFFTLQAQGVLWVDSRRTPGFERLSRRRAYLDTTMMATFWLSLYVILGARTWLYVVLGPMLIANFGLMSYIITNHMLRPMTDAYDTLATTISVRTFKLLDLLHFNFSHHVEHHLFPNIPGSAYPFIRQALNKFAPDHYLSPPHWRAFMLAFQMPKIYESRNVLVDPYNQRRVCVADIEAQIRNVVR